MQLQPPSGETHLDIRGLGREQNAVIHQAQGNPAVVMYIVKTLITDYQPNLEPEFSRLQ